MLKHKQKTGILLLTIIMLLTSVMLRTQLGIASNAEIEVAEIDLKNKRVVLGSDDFMIEVNGGGQVLFYHFNVSKVSFFLKLQQIVQFNDNNKNGHYDAGELVGGQLSTLQLPSVKWNLTIIANTSTKIEFLFNSSQIDDPFFKEVQLELFNHYTSDSSAVKFDVKISGWPFVEEATGLSLEFEFIWSKGPKALTKESNKTHIYLSNETGTILAYFGITNEITIDDGEPPTPGTATLHNTSAQQASKLNLFINYPRFSTLNHDPEFGTSQAALTSPTDPTSIVLWLEENVKAGFLGITVITTLILAALVVIVRTKKHR